MPMLPLALAAAAASPTAEPLWETVPPVPVRQEACALPPQWAVLLGSGALSRIDHNDVTLTADGPAWNGLPVDEQTLRAYVRAGKQLRPRPVTVLYLDTDRCDAMNRVAALIQAEGGCAPGYCLLSLDRPPARRLPPAPPAPPGPPPPPGKRPTPSGSPQSWVLNDDYPKAALRARMEGTTGFALQIDAEGRVTGCTVTSSSGHALLDDTTCSLLTARARFTPAENAQGVKIASEWRSRFRWELPSYRSPVASWVQVNRYRIDALGRASDCTEKRYGPVPDAFAICSSPDRVLPRGAVPAGQAVQVEIRFAHLVDGAPINVPPPPGAVPMSLQLRYGIDPAGKVIDCRRTGQAGGEVAGRLSSYDCHSGLSYAPADVAGRPAPTVTFTLSVWVIPEKP